MRNVDLQVEKLMTMMHSVRIWTLELNSSTSRAEATAKLSKPEFYASRTQLFLNHALLADIDTIKELPDTKRN